MHPRSGSIRRENQYWIGLGTNLHLVRLAHHLMTLDLANHFTGLGIRHITERTEKRMVAREQRENIMDTGTAVTQEWDAAWESDGESKEEESEGRNRMSLDEERQANEVFSKSSSIFSYYVVHIFATKYLPSVSLALFVLQPVSYRFE